MPVTRKPKEKDLEAFIQGGGSEPKEEIPDRLTEKAIQPLKVRIPRELLEEIDALVASRKPSPSRQSVDLRSTL